MRITKAVARLIATLTVFSFCSFGDSGDWRTMNGGAFQIQPPLSSGLHHPLQPLSPLAPVQHPFSNYPFSNFRTDQSFSLAVGCLLMQRIVELQFQLFAS